jgi:hypothetical protein
VRQRGLFIALGVWCLLSVVVELLHGGLAPESVTRLLILTYFLVYVCWYYKWGQLIEVKHPRRTFIVWCAINAMGVELFYMISKPLSPALLITSSTSSSQALRNIAIDLTLTLPAYLAIFSVIWLLAKRYHYSPFAFFFLMALGQALGDGGAFFLGNPGALILVPCVMLNYWAMNFVPYLVVRRTMPEAGLPVSHWKAIVLPLVLLPITYFVSGAIILTAGWKLGWI